MRCAQFSKKTKREATLPVRRSQRETATKNQPHPSTASSSTHNHTPSTSTATNGRAVHVHPATTTAVTKATTRSKAQQLTSTLNSIGPKPSQSESRSSGRHPYPPNCNNSKLKHKCPFDGCPWRFATPYKLRRHIKSHTKETPYLCKECGRGFSVRYNLLMHIQTIHSQPSRYKCPMRGCKEAFHSQPRLNGHLRRVHKKDWKTLHTSIKSEQQQQQQQTQQAELKSCNSRGSSTSSIDYSSSSSSSPPPSPDAPPPLSPSPPSSSSSSSSSAVSGAGGSKASGKPQSGKNTTRTQPKYPCAECLKEFPTQSKLTVHLRTHSGEKPFKCTVQGCDKCFASRERLTRHCGTHKNSNQFCCPHKNCHRMFLRQTHLKNHLKIHTQDHQFICPVLDCSQKFSSESEYNEHLNTHINYGYRCPHVGCELSFPARTRLAFHIRAVHKTCGANTDTTGACLLDGIQPHLGMPSAQVHSPSASYPLLPHSNMTAAVATSSSSSSSRGLQLQLSAGSCSHLAAGRNHGGGSSHNFDEEMIKDVDLPGLSVDDIETVLSENADWSGEQIDQFLRSAVDLSEIESKLFTSGGYESDSGYSTYDVSPITSAAPMQLSYQNGMTSSMVGLQPCHTALSPPILTPVERTPGPIFGCTLSPTNSTTFAATPISPASSATSPLDASSTTTAAGSEMSFFPSVPNFSSVSPAAVALSSQENFYTQSCPIFTTYSQSQDYTSSQNIFGMNSHSQQCFPEVPPSVVPPPIPSFSSQIPDIMLPTSVSQFPAIGVSTQFERDRGSLSGFATLQRCSEGLVQNGGPFSRNAASKPTPSELNIAQRVVGTEPMDQYTPVFPKLEHQQTSCALGNSSNNNNSSPVETIPLSEPADNPLSNLLEASNPMLPTSPVSMEQIDTPLNSTTSSASPPLDESTSPSDVQAASKNTPSSQLQSVVSLCSQIPSFNKLVASSSNPAVFLVAVSTALSTLNTNASETKAQSIEGPCDSNSSGLVGDDSEKLRQIDMSQLSSLVANIETKQASTEASTATVLDQDEDKSSTTAAHESMCFQTESQDSSPTANANKVTSEKPAVFAQVVHHSQSTCTTTKAGHREPLVVTTTSTQPVQSSLQAKHGELQQVSSKAHESRSNNNNTSASSSNSASEKTGRISKSRGCKTGGAAMKAAQRKKGQWPKSMNKANLLAFRQHILNKLKKGQEAREPCVVVPAGKEKESTVKSESGGSKTPIRCEAVTPPSKLEAAYEQNHSVKVSYERNHTIERCHSEPVDRLSPLNESLHQSQSVENVNLFSADGDELKPLELFFSSPDCNDILSGMQFNPDAFLSSSMHSNEGGGVLEGFEGMTDLDLKADDEIVHLLSGGSSCDGSTDMDFECINDFFKETAPELSEAVSSPPIHLDLVLGKSPTGLHSPSPTLSRSYSITSTASVQCFAENPSPVPFSGDFLRQASSIGSPSYTFPELNSLNGSVSDLGGSVGCESSMKLHLQQLEMHNDPLLAGSIGLSGHFDM